MELTTILSIVSILVGLVALASVLVRVGQERQARADLERRHDELAKEFREHKSAYSSLVNRIAVVERGNEVQDNELKNFQHRLAEKASIESVEALRASLARIEAQVTSIANKILHEH